MIDFGYTLLDRPGQVDFWGIHRAYDAALLSDHPRTQVGASIKSIPGWNRKEDHREASQDIVELGRIHAEVCAILSYLKSSKPDSTRPTLYAPWASCTQCATVILHARFNRVVVHHELMQMTPDKWLDEVKGGIQMLLGNSVRVEAISKNFGRTIRFNGEEVTV